MSGDLQAETEPLDPVADACFRCGEGEAKVLGDFAVGQSGVEGQVDRFSLKNR